MKLVIGQSRRITIPSDLYKQLGLKPGDTTYIYIEDNKLVLTKEQPKNETINNIDDIQKDVKTDCSTLQSAKNTTKDKNIIIKSNIEDLNKYAKPLLSDCKLVVRSKRKYINQFCDVCKGQLVKDNINCNCKYKQTQNKQHETKQILKEIEQNKKQLQSKLDENINKLTQDNIYFKGDTILEPVTFSSGLKCCNECQEYFTKGFLMDNKFYCKECAKQNFLKYVNYKKGRRI